MLPTLVLVGRPNVGKSTLFNRLTRTRAALVADLPGLTRDRHFGRARIGEQAYLVVDTGGFEPVATEGIVGFYGASSMERLPTERALTENTAPPVLCQTALSPDRVGWAVAAVPSVATRPTRLPSLVSSRWT